MNYENKLALAKEALESGSYDKKTIEYIFPELKEEENLNACLSYINDEYLRSWLKDAIFSKYEHKPVWKPSEEQMKALHDLNLTGNLSYAGQGQVFIGLYKDLLKLKKKNSYESKQNLL